MKPTVKDTSVVVVQYLRGATALIWIDPASRAVLSSDAGLSAMLHQGVRGWDGRLVSPGRGHEFLTAVYDRLFINGCAVRWMHARAAFPILRRYPV